VIGVARRQNQHPDDEKLRELILYVSTLSKDDDNFGATKLNKLLFYADFLAYQRSVDRSQDSNIRRYLKAQHRDT
jgi:hypothetical protein